MDSRQKLQARFSLIYVVGAILAVLLLQEYLIAPMMAGEEEVPYSQFRQDLATGAIAEVSVEPERIVYTMSESGEEAGEAVKTRKAVRIEDEDLVEELVEAGCRVSSSGAHQRAFWSLCSVGSSRFSHSW